MNEKDDVILEYLANTGVAEPPTVLHFNITQRGATFSIDTTRRRLKRLLNVNLIEIVYEDGRYYQITNLGRQYLAGELDASDLE